jgi:hypothetical protein
MKAHIKQKLRLFLTIALLLLFTLPVLAQSGGGFDLSWSTTDGGGGSSSGGIFSLAGTAGQPDAGVMSGGVYALAGGFWGGGVATITQLQLYLPVIVK